MWASVIAIIGTLAGAIVSGLLQHRAARADREDVQAEERWRAAVDSVTALARALSDHRAAMWAREHARLTGAEETRGRELRDESHRTRSEITDPAVRLRLLVLDAGVRAAAEEATQATYRMRGSADLGVLQAGRAEALDAHNRLVETAGRYLAAAA